MPRNAEERSHHSNRISFQQILEEGTVFDMTGKTTKTATMKLDLQRGRALDDVLPDELRPIWVSHFKIMQEIREIKFQRVVVQEQAINLEIQTTDAADASQKLA